jgi:hypothetical protein
MFVAQDPRRDPKNSCSDYITLGTPFALHSPWGREKGITTRQVFQAVQFWLDNDWRVYLTDAIKIFAYDREKCKSKVIPKCDREQFNTILEAEIHIFQPKVIVTIGSVAHWTVRQLCPHKKIVDIPHFSSANCRRWKEILGKSKPISSNVKLDWYYEKVKQEMGESFNMQA